jgi:hypothetical protein
MRQTSAPDSTLSCPNLDLEMGHEDALLQPSRNLSTIGRGKEKLDRFPEVFGREFHALTLAGHVKLGTKRHKTVALFLHDGC